ncbi:MAG: hypothetical protein M3O68_09280 [Thermoproteota archaeon]|nr:hypothetical protein [Thermoproteota archaeon]
MSVPYCLIGTVLGKHVHPLPTTTHKDIQHAIDATLSSALGLPLQAGRIIDDTQRFH